MAVISKNFLGFTIKEYEILDSTNDEAKRLILQNKNFLYHNTIILALSQTAGRGRNNREWISESGNLFTSFIFDISKEASPQNYSYFFALAIAKFLQNLEVTPQIKWPNDVLVNNKKICGILLEKQENYLICGVGFNIFSAPDYLIEKPTTSLSQLGFNYNLEFCLNEIIKNFNQVKMLNDNFGFQKIADEINKILLTNFAEINLYDKKISGQILKIDEMGLLNFLSEGEIKKISSGEVFFL